MPITIPSIPDESEVEYNLRLAAEIIRTHAPEAEVIHQDYDDDEPVTGNEVIASIERIIADLAEYRVKNGKSMTIDGTIIQAGGEGKEDPTITITTSVRELKKQKSIPFFRRCEIRFTPDAY